MRGEREHVIEHREFNCSDIELDPVSKGLFQKLESVRVKLRTQKDQNREVIVTPEFVKSLCQEREAFKHILRKYRGSRKQIKEIENIIIALIENEDFPRIEIRSLFSDDYL